MEINNDYIYKSTYCSLIYDYLLENGSETFIKVNREAAILFVYSGELIISCENETICLKKGEYAFVKRGIVIEINKKNLGNEKFSSAFIGFDRHFLWWFHCKMCNRSLIHSKDKFDRNLIKLPRTPCLHSLYISLETYKGYGEKPTIDILSLKLQEGIYSLIMIDNRFYSCLFDFIYPFDSNLI